MTSGLSIIIKPIFLLGFAAFMQAQSATIAGHIQPDSSWARSVYVCRIPEFNQMFTASPRYLVSEGKIDSAGDFKINVPAGDSDVLFRLHLVRKNDPPSMLIIGGNDQNHAFFIAKAGDHIQFNPGASGRLINQQGVSGTRANTDLNALIALLKSESIGREELKDSLLRHAKNASSTIVTLMAIENLYKLNPGQKKQVRQLLREIPGGDPYALRLIDQYAGHSLTPVYILLLGILLLLASYMGYRYIQARKYQKIRMALSQRETDIVQAILGNKSNKEIAEKLNIELSTVKTHINNIFGKLELKNRRQLRKYRKAFEK